VTRNAYLLFYRRRTPVPLGPESLRKIVQAAETDPTADSEAEDDESNDRSRPRDAANNNSDSGNGQRLDVSSRNGSSSAGTGVAAGAQAQRGLGYSDRGSRLKNGAGVANLSDDDDDEGMLPMVDGSNDEGFVDAEEGDIFDSINNYGEYHNDTAVWSFEGIGSRNNDSDDVASDAPNLGSGGGDDLSTRMLEDFGDDIVTGHTGVGTPVDDGEVHEIRVLGE
jgi:ubiquitin carboxyl-terminal hydrolase 4/11/15